VLAVVLATTTTSVEARRGKEAPKISLVEVLEAFDMIPKPETFAKLRDPTPQNLTCDQAID
jgi:hypothetical protein